VCLRLGHRIKDQLGEAFFITQVDKNQIAVVSIGMCPSSQCYLFAGIFQPKPPASMRSFEHLKNLSKIRVSYTAAHFANDELFRQLE
jgi:hypothetical protein